MNPSILVNTDAVDIIDFASPAQSASVYTSIVATSSIFRGLSCTVRNSHLSLCPNVYRTHCFKSCMSNSDGFASCLDKFFTAHLVDHELQLSNSSSVSLVTVAMLSKYS